jgi:hypothetical protein
MQEIVTEIALMLAVRLFAVEIHELSTATHDALVGAPSMGQFYKYQRVWLRRPA